jgi:hypothetical protein
MKIGKLILFSLIICTLACKQESENEYQKMERKELASGIRKDSLFLGYFFGMTRDSFFKHSFTLNRQHQIMNGQGAEILYVPTGFKSPAGMSFYPNFNIKTNQIFEMPVTFSYQAWAPWNKDLWSNELIKEVKKYMETFFGSGFVIVNDKELGAGYAKIDGNRRILIYKKGDAKVSVMITDMKAVTGK